MSNWDQLYDLEPLLRTPPTEAISKQHSYITVKPYKRYDSDVSSISSTEGVDDFDSPTWCDILDHEEEVIQRYKKFLHGQLHKEQNVRVEKAEPEVVVTRVEGTDEHSSHKQTDDEFKDSFPARKVQGEE
ncbi:hypothetical protein E4T39_03469 [Aureobasidium subglaciale]|nr:hypothetical protein E4T39_03469 [Aureobasidium subglaciale]